jgi:hypothetical protein
MSENMIEQPEPVPVPEAGEPAPETPEQQDDSTPSKREQKYRMELRESQAREAEKDALIERMQWAEVHRIAGAKLADPPDAMRDGAPADCLDEAGQVSADLVGDQIDAIAAAHPHYVRPPEPTNPPLPNAGGKIGIPSSSVLNPAEAEPAPSWTDVLRAAAGGT